MLKTRLIDLRDRIWARSVWMAKAIVGVAAPILADWLLELLELLEQEGRFWVAVLVGGVAVFTVPNDPTAPDRVKSLQARGLRAIR